MSKLTKISPWHEKFAAVINTQFADVDELFRKALDQKVKIGFLLVMAKEQGKADGSIPHGQFGPFLEKMCPNTSWQRICECMKMARNIAQAGDFQISGFRKFAAGRDFEPAALLGNGQGLPAPIKTFLEHVDKSVSGATQNKLMVLNIRQAEEGDNGEIDTKHGRLKGKGGASAAQRAAAKARVEAGEIAAMETWADDAIEVITQSADDAHWGKIADDKAKQLLEAFELGAGYLKRLIQGRKQK